MLHRWETSIPGLAPDFSRSVYVLTPPSYEEDTDRRYPVLYMFDGQNLFLDEDASFGTSWNLAEFFDTFDPNCIIAAVQSNPHGNERLCEYSPFTHHTEELGLIHGKARTQMDWLLGTLKPQIDDAFRTYPDRDNTFIGGSSMGGLISLYGITRYNHAFSRAACLSPSLWVGPGKVQSMIERSELAPHTLIYMDYGSEELPNHADTYKALHMAVSLCLRKQVDLTFRIDPYGTHSEASWASRVLTFMTCLGLMD